MSERPILFSAPMVRALLDGAKTQTRRPVQPQPPQTAASAGAIHSGTSSHGQWWWLDSKDLEWASVVGDPFRCRYGVPGDRLWVRETWRERDPDQEGRTLDYRADHGPGEDPCWVPWRPSIHMPRRASRISLELTDVRVERLHEISEQDAKDEGISEFVGGWWCKYEDDLQRAGATPQEGYRHLWERINGAGSWEANPWVWVIEFRRA